MPAEAAIRATLAAGIAVFIDDNQPLLRKEKAIAANAGMEVLEISVGEDLNQRVDEIFQMAKDRELTTDRMVFFIDNRMGDFAKVLENKENENVLFFERHREKMGQHGKHVGMAIAEWLVSTYSSAKPGFYLALLSGFSDEGITRRLRTLKEQYPRFLGFLTKIASDADRSTSEDDRIRQFRDAIVRVTSHSPPIPAIQKGPANYPYGQILLSIIQDLEFTSEEAASFLRLSISAAPKLNVLYEDPASFELDTCDWQEKVFLVWELLLILEHDFDEFQKVLVWLKAPHLLLNQLTPRELIVSGLISEIDTLRSIVKY